MLANAWIEDVPDATDGRGLPLRVAPAGAELLDALGPAWRRAQSRAADLIGGEGRTAVVDLFDKVQAAVRA
jgi:DNA-binding MarR family transcriptional regulator